MLKKGFSFFVLLFILTNNVLVAQVKFVATIVPNEIGKNEFAQLKLSVENAQNVEKIVTPNLNNFIVESGPNQETGFSDVNGVVKKYVALTYIIRPKSTGTITIPSTTAIADGVEYKSNGIKIKVGNISVGNSNAISPFGNMGIMPEPQTNYKDHIIKKGENAADKARQNMFVKVDVTKTTCFVGEPIVATYKLYTRLKSESNVVKNPSFNGFSVIDLEQPNSMYYSNETFKGKEYNVYTLRKAQLYPLQVGTFNLDEAEIENTVSFIKEEYIKGGTQNLFNAFGEAMVPETAFEKFKISLKNNSVSILVKPLPSKNIPVSFKGAVGRFQINATLEKDKFTTDETAKLRITLSGEGNLHLINIPEVKWPKNIEVFEPNTKEDLFKTTVPVSGTKTIEYPFVADSAGNYLLDSLQFSYFDDKTNLYKTIAVKPIAFTVSKGVLNKEKANTTELQKSTSWLNSFFSNRRLVISFFAIFALIVLFFWARKDKQKNIDQEAIKAAIAKENTLVEAKILFKEKDWLTQTKNCLEKENAEEFYKIVNTEMKIFLANKIRIDAAIISKNDIIEWLDAGKISLSTSMQVQNFINNVEAYLYNPFAEKQPMYMVYQEAEDIVQKIKEL